MVGEVILAHAVGDYLLQSHWMATEKTSRWLPAVVHGVTYGLPFLLVTQSPAALAVIVLTHIVIDRFRLARHVVWFKNQIGPKRTRPVWGEDVAGYPAATPAWLATWLMIIADNTLHLLINVGAVMWL